MIKKLTVSHKGKKYNAIIESSNEIIIGKIYPARYKETVMSNKTPVWFQSFQKEMMEFKSDQMKFNKEINQRLTNIESSSTIKKELKK